MIIQQLMKASPSFLLLIHTSSKWLPFSSFYFKCFERNLLLVCEQNIDCAGASWSSMVQDSFLHSLATYLQFSLTTESLSSFMWKFIPYQAIIHANLFLSKKHFGKFYNSSKWCFMVHFFPSHSALSRNSMNIVWASSSLLHFIQWLIWSANKNFFKAIHHCWRQLS